MKPSMHWFALATLLVGVAPSPTVAEPRPNDHGHPTPQVHASGPGQEDPARPPLPTLAVQARIDTLLATKTDVDSAKRAVTDLMAQSLPAHHREQLLVALVDRIALGQPSAESRATLEELTSYRGTAVRHWHHEGTLIEEPLHDVAAAARRGLDRWNRDAAAQRVKRAAAEEPSLLPDLLDPAGPAAAAARRGALAALASLDGTALDALGDELLDEVEQRPGLAEAAREIGLLRNRTDLMASALRSGPARVALGAVQALPGPFDATEALELIDVALERPELASAALLALAPAAGDDGAARETLFSFLADPAHGGSAAAALATIGDGRISARLGRTLDHEARPEAPPDSLTARRAVLALRLRQDPLARQTLERFAAAEATTLETLRNEVRQWLGR